MATMVMSANLREKYIVWHVFTHHVRACIQFGTMIMIPIILAAGLWLHILTIALITGLNSTLSTLTSARSAGL